MKHISLVNTNQQHDDGSIAKTTFNNENGSSGVSHPTIEGRETQ